MDFGKVDKQTLESVDFTLPPDGDFTKLVLTGTRVADPKVYVGGAKWGRKEWLGIIYPDKTKESDFLGHYVNHFNGIELNATHYKIYPQAGIKKWADNAKGKDFKFCPKVPQVISHYTDLGTQKAQHLTDEFLRGIMGFGTTLGPIFLQLSERYGPSKKEQLLYYLQQLPKDVRFFLEVRHPEWFSDIEMRSWLFGHLKDLSVGAVITDTAGRRDCLHMEITTPEVFIRFVGNGLHRTDYERVDAWAERINSWLDKGLKEVHFYTHQPDELYTPEMTAYIVEKFNKVCGLDLEPPAFIEKTGSLF